MSIVRASIALVSAGAADVGAVMEERMKKKVEKEKTYQVLLNYLSTQPDIKLIKCRSSLTYAPYFPSDNFLPIPLSHSLLYIFFLQYDDI
jgi:hypothetical protein